MVSEKIYLFSPTHTDMERVKPCIIEHLDNRVKDAETVPEHFIPWCRTPYKRDPQWSQNMGDAYVCALNLCFVRES